MVLSTAVAPAATAVASMLSVEGWASTDTGWVSAHVLLRPYMTEMLVSSSILPVLKLTAQTPVLWSAEHDAVSSAVALRILTWHRLCARSTLVL